MLSDDATLGHAVLLVTLDRSSCPFQVVPIVLFPQNYLPRDFQSALTF
jgi:hypothetical protein